MKSIGIVKGLVKKFDVGQDRGNFYDLRKFLRDELNRVHVGFYDPCCPEANGGGTDSETFVAGTRFNAVSGSLEYWDPIAEEWTTIDEAPSEKAYVPDAVQNDITAGTGGAISVANYFTTINTDAGGDAFTLADGTHVGQLKKILLVVDGGGDAVITPANLADGTTVTLDDAADYIILRWNGTDWRLIENVGGTLA